MRSLPAAIDRLANLKEIALMGSHLSELPEEIGNLTNLKSFKNLTLAEFFSLPASVGNLTKLKELDLSRSSRLDDLPEEIGILVFLETLRLRASGLPSLPNSIGDLINLKELDPQHCQSRILDFGWFTVMSRMNPRRRPSRICRIVFHRKSLVPRGLKRASPQSVPQKTFFVYTMRISTICQSLNTAKTNSPIFQQNRCTKNVTTTVASLPFGNWGWCKSKTNKNE